MAKSRNNVKVLIPFGYGLNCERETAFGYRMLGADADIVHINDIAEKPSMIDDYHILALIGGFVDGDHIASGRVHANRLKYKMGEQLDKFIKDGKLVIGACNGFQVMVKYGLLPAFDSNYKKQTVTLTSNDSGIFEDRWIHMKSNPRSPCVWTKGIEKITLPIRHGEGKIRTDMETLAKMEKGGHIALQYMNPDNGKVANDLDYPNNPNGSMKSIAGLCDSTGRVFGMMPHWEAFMSPYSHPEWTRLKLEGKLPKEGAGLQIARNGVEYARKNLL